MYSILVPYQDQVRSLGDILRSRLHLGRGELLVGAVEGLEEVRDL